jgi:hypothetical protein
VVRASRRRRGWPVGRTAAWKAGLKSERNVSYNCRLVPELRTAGAAAGSATLASEMRVSETDKNSDLRDHNPNRPLASSLLLEPEGRRPAVPLDL